MKVPQANPGEVIAQDVSAYQSGRELAGTFAAVVTLRPSRSVEEAREAVLEEVRALAEEGPTEEELRRVATMKTASFLYALEHVGGFGGVADRLNAYNVYRGDPGLIRADLPTVLDLVSRMELDPGLPAAFGELESRGWEVVVTSAGCAWYIRRLLDGAGVRPLVWANPGAYRPDEGLVMSLPRDIPFFSPELGVDKAAVVRDALARSPLVAFAGDGLPDLEPARLVPADLRFARGDLAEALRREGLAFAAFERWSEVAETICRRADLGTADSTAGGPP